MLSPSKKTKKVAAYCRVSTDKEDQANSLESQRRFFCEYIGRNPCWTLAEIYVDEGITGTSTKKRRAFNRMMEDAEKNAFDLVLTKEISRFARNTLDSILYTRKLKELGVGVNFLNDGINTLDPDAELRLTIMASIAQEESRRTSERVKWGQKRRMEQGVVFGRDLLGYDVKNGRLFVNEAGAEAVRLIFHKFANEGKGAHLIARELQKEGVPAAAHMKQWSKTAVLRVLRNEKYCGDLVQKKTFTPSYLTHEKRRNRGEEELVVHRDHHEPVISRELFEKAQNELKKRAPSAESKARHSNRHCFSGKIQCGICGCSYVSRTKKREGANDYHAWRCGAAAKHGTPGPGKSGGEAGCGARSVNDKEARRMVQQAFCALEFDRQGETEALLAAIDRVARAEGAEPEKACEAGLNRIRHKKRRLLELYMENGITKREFEEANSAYCAQESALLGEIEGINERKMRSGDPKEGGRGMVAFLNELSRGALWSDAFYRAMLERITINEDNTAKLRFKGLPVAWIFSPEAEKGRHFGSAVPMSVNVALTLSSGIEYR